MRWFFISSFGKLFLGSRLVTHKDLMKSINDKQRHIATKKVGIF